MMAPEPTTLPCRLTSARARSMAECRWGRGGTRVMRTNTHHAYYFSCSGHGGYIIDGAVLTDEQRAQIDCYVQPEMVTVVVRGEVVDFMQNPFSMRQQSYRARPGQEQVKHPVYLFEEDNDWVVLEKFTGIRRLEFPPGIEDYTAYVEKCFDAYVALRSEGRSPRVEASDELSP